MLDSAVRVFARRGFHAANMDEIAELSGVSKPMVYAYLGNKDELFIACLRREAGRLLENVAGAVDPDLPPDQQLWRGLWAFFGYVGAHRDGWAVLYRQARSIEPFASELAVMRRGMVDIIVAKLAAALAAEGRQSTEEDLLTMAFALVGAGESLADHLAASPSEDPEKMATRMMNAVWLGAGQLLAGRTWRPEPDGPTRP
jgi:AcrR family transcriptional regulator